MSRNNKNARLHAEARAWSKMRKNGDKGPARTTPKHDKVNVRWKMSETAAARKAVLLKTAPASYMENFAAEKEKKDRNEVKRMRKEGWE